MAEIDVGALVRSWTHVSEEDSEDLVVFRSSDSDIPPARGRESMELAAGGVLRHLAPGPDDRRVSRVGSWRLEASELTLHTDQRPNEHYQVESVDGQRLVLRRSPRQDPSHQQTRGGR